MYALNPNMHLCILVATVKWNKLSPVTYLGNGGTSLATVTILQIGALLETGKTTTCQHVVFELVIPGLW